MIFTVAAAITVAGCQTQQQMMDQQQPDARHVAQRRGAFELNCPAATAELLSKGIVPQPAFAIAEIAPPQRAEYTVGVSGCGKRATYLVVCPLEGTGCIATGSRDMTGLSNDGAQ